MSNRTAVVPSQLTWFGQPRGLTILFLTEMWEQFSYYGMRALLVYYMTRQLLLGQEKASLVYGTYTALAYFTPIFGGVLTDRWLGKRRAVVNGGTIMALGHFLMTFEPLLYVALATIALGNGLFLPSLPSQINDLYGPRDARLGRAYNVYYVGINLGGFLAPLICGTLGEFYGWHWGFAAAGVGMLLGLMVALWSDAGIDRHAGASVIPMTWFQSLNPLLVFIMTPLLLSRWKRRAERGAEPSALRKMALGALIVALAYALLAGISAVYHAQPVHWLWLALFFAIFTWGELYILPTRLGLFARLAPPSMAATTVAAWFLAIFTGSLTAGAVGTLWSSTSHAEFFVIRALLALVASGMLITLDVLNR